MPLNSNAIANNIAHPTLPATRRGEKGETKDKEGGGWEGTQEGAENWERVVELVQTAFRYGDLAEEATWQAVVLIPKGESTTGASASWR